MGQIVRKAKIRGWGKVSSRCLRPTSLHSFPMTHVFVAHNSNKILHSRSWSVRLACLISHVKNIVSHIIFSGRI